MQKGPGENIETIEQLNSPGVLTTYGLEELTKEYPMFKKYDKLFFALIQQGAEKFELLGKGKDGYVLEIRKEKQKGIYVVKLPIDNPEKILTEYSNHCIFLKAWYKGLQDPKYKEHFKYIEMPFLSEKYSQYGHSIVMDKLPGYTLKQHMLRKRFEPLFADKKSLEELEWLDDQGKVITNDDTIEQELIAYIKGEIDRGEIEPETVISAKYKKYNVKELVDQASAWNDNKPEDLKEFDRLLTKKEADKLRNALIKFRSFCREEGINHEDLHSGNVMLVPNAFGKYNLGIIDFGRVKIEDKEKFNSYHLPSGQNS